jgi:hypothetical protein
LEVIGVKKDPIKEGVREHRGRLLGECLEDSHPVIGQVCPKDLLIERILDFLSGVRRVVSVYLDRLRDPTVNQKEKARFRLLENDR